MEKIKKKKEKRVRKNKLLALLLVFAAVLGGCNAAGKGISPGKTPGDVQGQGGASGGNGTAAVYEQPEMKGEITISAMYEVEFLKAAAKGFMDKYPDVKINIHAAVEDLENDGGGGAKYREQLNTKIMSGKAEDIICTALIPVKKYMDMGVFEDLSGYLSTTPQMDEEHYFMNVLKSAEDENGHIYIVPYACSFSVTSFEKKIVGNAAPPNAESGIRFSGAAAYAKKHMDEAKVKNSFLTQLGDWGYMQSLIYEYWDTLVDEKGKKANVNTNQYIGWLNETKELKDKGYFNPEGLDFYNTRYYFAMNDDFETQAAFYNLYGESDGGSCMGMPAADEKGNVFTSAGQCLAINSASKNKALAWEFIRYVLSAEAQSMPSLFSPAVNKESFPAWAQKALKVYTDGTKQGVSAKDYQALLEKWIKCINKCNLKDIAIVQYFEEENVKFFEGKQSAGQTAKNIENKVTQYLKE